MKRSEINQYIREAEAFLASNTFMLPPYAAWTLEQWKEHKAKGDIESIIDIELRDVRVRALEAGYRLTVTPSAKRFVADAGYDPAYGARPLRRAVTRYVEDPVSEFIISDRILVSRTKADGALRTLRVALTPDKEATQVELVKG